MKKIFKYPLLEIPSQIVTMHQGSRILSIQVQNRILCIWALVDEDMPLKKHKILIFGTGQEIDTEFILTFMGTVQMGNFVWHVFEQLNNGNRPI